MRKTLGICVAASLALLLGGCGDDDSACIGSCEEGDASGTGSDDTDTTTDTDESDESDESESTTDTSSSTDEESDSSDTESTTPETDAGSTSESPEDGGGADEDSGTVVETDAAVPEGDGGVTADAGDAATEEETDSGTDTEDEDAGPVRSEACAAACATGAEADGCEDTAACDSSVCGIEQGNPAHCVDEANAYLECISAADPSTDFVCDDGAPTYIASGCDTELFTWIDCTNTPE